MLSSSVLGVDSWVPNQSIIPRHVANYHTEQRNSCVCLRRYVLTQNICKILRVLQCTPAYRAVQLLFKLDILKNSFSAWTKSNFGDYFYPEYRYMLSVTITIITLTEIFIK